MHGNNYLLIISYIYSLLHDTWVDECLYFTVYLWLYKVTNVQTKMATPDDYENEALYAEMAELYYVKLFIV